MYRQIQDLWMYQRALGVLLVGVASRSAGEEDVCHFLMGDNTVPVQRPGPHTMGGAPGAARRTVLLTGASGVVGRPLLQRLRDLAVVCLVHRSPVSGPNVTTALGDIAKPGLGLAEQAYEELAAKVDAVIHCAAITDFNRADGGLETTNITGTQNVAGFAAAANAVLYHVSTAFVNTKV